MLVSSRATVSNRAASLWWYSDSKILRSASTRCATACSTASSNVCTGCNSSAQRPSNKAAQAESGLFVLGIGLVNIRSHDLATQNQYMLL